MRVADRGDGPAPGRIIGSRTCPRVLLRCRSRSFGPRSLRSAIPRPTPSSTWENELRLAETSSPDANHTRVWNATERANGRLSIDAPVAKPDDRSTFERVDRLHPSEDVANGRSRSSEHPPHLFRSMGGRRRGLERAAMEGTPDRQRCVIFTEGAVQTVFGAPSTHDADLRWRHIDSMHDRSVRGSYRRSGGEGEEPHRFQTSGPKRIVDRAQSKDRARVGGVNRPIPVRLTVFRAARRIDGGKAAEQRSVGAGKFR